MHTTPFTATAGPHLLNSEHDGIPQTTVMKKSL